MKQVIIICIMLLSFANGHLLKAQSTLALVESAGGCTLASDCDDNVVCFDIVLTPMLSASIQSYNIWVHYPGTELDYLSDNTCVAVNSTDNNLNEDGHYRVAAAQGAFPVTVGVPVSIHTICFTYPDIDLINNADISVGGTLFGVLFSPITFMNPVFNEPSLDESPFELNSTTVSCVLLPVTWLNFQAEKSGSKSMLTWKTSNEINHAGFDVERSRDGQIFEKIGSVPAATVTQEVSQYQFADVRPYSGMNYYRIKQIDHDGRTDYSPVKTVVFGDSYTGIRIWPNPTDGLVNIAMELEESEEIRVSVVDHVGKSLFARKYNASEWRDGIDIHHLAPGVYTLMIETAHDQYTEQISVIR